MNKLMLIIHFMLSCYRFLTLLRAFAHWMIVSLYNKSETFLCVRYTTRDRRKLNGIYVLLRKIMRLQ